MSFFNILFLAIMVSPMLLLSSPIQTDYAIFLFDNGDKNMIASMLKYAEENDKSALEKLNFRIIFMGASIDAMTKEPFSHYSEKLLHYKQLGITETIDNNWIRDKKLNLASLKELSKNIKIQKKILVGVSCSIFEQILQHYQLNSNVDIVAVRDNPSPYGDTDYFRVAQEVQNTANKIAVPSIAVFNEIDAPNKRVVVIGHAPMEEWLKDAYDIDKVAIINKLWLNSKLPIIVYTGVYGDYYKECFEKFLDILPSKNVQVIIVPHPRYKGIIETKVCEERKSELAQFKIVGEFMEDPLKRIKTVEALSIADVVVTADATSTIVFQANAIKKRVLYVNPASSSVSKMLCDKKLIYKISSMEEFLRVVENIQSDRKAPLFQNEDVFKLLGIPKHGAKLLWSEFLNCKDS